MAINWTTMEQKDGGGASSERRDAAPPPPPPPPTPPPPPPRTGEPSMFDRLVGTSPNISDWETMEKKLGKNLVEKKTMEKRNESPGRC